MKFSSLSLCTLLLVISLPSSYLYTIKFAYQNVLFSAPTRKPNPISAVSILIPTSTVPTVTENSSLEDNALVVAVESKNEPEELVRNLLCADNKTGESPTNFRYDLKNGVCAEIGVQGHCGRNMAFKEEADSPAYGYCDCDFDGNAVPLVYHPKSEACYFVYTQAYCPKGEWLAFNRKARKAVCEPNKCINMKGEAEKEPTQKELARSKIHSDLPHSVPLNGNGTCVQLNTANHPLCDQNEEVQFSPNHVFPTCALPLPSLRSHSILPNPCPIGSFYSIIGRCQPDWDF